MTTSDASILSLASRRHLSSCWALGKDLSTMANSQSTLAWPTKAARRPASLSNSKDRKTDRRCFLMGRVARRRVVISPLTCTNSAIVRSWTRRLGQPRQLPLFLMLRQLSQ